MQVASVTGVGHDVAMGLSQQSGKKAKHYVGRTRMNWNLGQRTGTHENKLELTSASHHPQSQ